ncbi:MAG TPA: MBL fold metallo-hydrolase [Candidatus Baltobacteraceae bacterium]|jgi:hypothetical protein|nr:MBL fold metallo-hydrolase [Candidatus Baltobacteraceae bacterium]
MRNHGKIVLSAAVAALLCCPLRAHADGAAAPDMVRHSIDAMCGRACLQALNSVEYTAVGFRDMVEQSVRPTGPYFLDYETVHVIRDYSRHRTRADESHLAYGADKWWLQQTAPSTDTYVINDDVAATLKDGAYRYAGGYFLAFDDDQYGFSPERVLLAAAAAPDLRQLPDEALHGFMHHVVGYTWRDARAKLYLNPFTGLPTMVQFTRAYPYHTFLNTWGDVTTRITYEGWNLEQGGLRYPRQWNYQRENLPDMTLVLTQLQFNPQLSDAALTLPADVYAKYHNRLRATDDVPLGASGSGPPQELAPGVVQVSGGWNVTYVKQDDGVIVIEAPWSPPYSKRAFAAARARFGLPVKAVITTSDSWPHIAGVRQAVAEGIPVYALDLNLPILRRLVAAPHTIRPDDLARNRRSPHFVTVSQRVAIGTGPNRIEIVPYREETAERQMMVYFPGHKLLYTSDLFSPDSDGSWFTPEYAHEALDAIRRERLDVQTIFGMHYGPTPFTQLH